MKASELLHKIQQLIALHGDQDIVIDLPPSEDSLGAMNCSLLASVDAYESGLDENFNQVVDSFSLASVRTKEIEAEIEAEIDDEEDFHELHHEKWSEYLFVNRIQNPTCADKAKFEAVFASQYSFKRGNAS